MRVPFITDSFVSADGVSAIAGHVNGLPYTSGGKLAVAVNGVVSHVFSGIPFSSDGRVCVEESDADHYCNGIPFTSAGRIAYSETPALEMSAGIPIDGGKTSIAITARASLPNRTRLSQAARLEKLRADYDEFAVYTPIHPDGIRWARWFFSNRLNSGNAGCPRLQWATLCWLYAQTAVAKVTANLTTGTIASTPVVSQGTAAATTRSGTWTASATVGGVTDIRYSTVVGDYVEYTVTGVTRLAHRAYQNSSNGGLAALSIKESGVEISDSLKRVPSGIVRLNDSPLAGHKLTWLADGLNPALTYVVRLTLDASTPGASRLYDGGVLGFDAVAFDDVGVHGIVYDQPNGTPSVTYSASRDPGTITVYRFDDCTRVDAKYYSTTIGGKARFTVYDSGGSQVATEEVDTYAASVAHQTITVCEGQTKGTYYLHIENLNDKNASSSRWQVHEAGGIALDETAAGDPASDEFSIGGVTSNAVTADLMLQGTGNVELAIRCRKSANANGVGEDFVGGIHGHETSPASLSVSLDSVDISAAYGAASAGETWNGAEVSISFDTTLQFVDGGDFADASYAFTLNREGYRTDASRTTTADAYIENEYVIMLQAPKNSPSYGGGVVDVQSGTGEVISATEDDDSSNPFAATNTRFAVYNAAGVATVELLNESDVIEDFAGIGNAPDEPFVQDRSDGFTKVYRDARDFGAVSGGTLVSSGHSATYQRMVRVGLR